MFEKIAETNCGFMYSVLYTNILAVSEKIIFQNSNESYAVKTQAMRYIERNMRIEVPIKILRVDA